MTEKNTPKPGELWQTDGGLGDRGATAFLDSGWHWGAARVRCVEQDRTLVGEGPIGYTAEYVDNLRERAEAAEGALAVHLNDNTNDFQTVVDDEPRRVLREAADVCELCLPDLFGFLNGPVGGLK